MIPADIYKVLSESSAIIAIASSRIYPLRLPQGAIVPAVVYSIHNIVPIKSLSGESGLDNALVDITCWAKDYTTAHLLASAVRSAFVESGAGVMEEMPEDIEDEETRNFGVVMTMNVWSISNVGLLPQTLKDPIAYMEQAQFVGDGVTRDFPLPKFRSGSLLIFFNGRVAKKGLESDMTSAYWEKTTLDGFVFRVAPKGGEYKDEILAYYAKN